MDLPFLSLNLGYISFIVCINYLLLGDYEQNTCLINQDPSCIPCRERLPSCMGLISGNHTFPGRELSSFYIVCFRNRTEAVRSCDNGFFDPESGTCMATISAGEQ